MKVGLLIPYRLDRPRFLEHLKKMIDSQTLKPDIIHFVDYAPETENIDITQRYRRGYDFLRNKGLDVIAFIEVDDWYSSDYLETMVNKWQELGRPELLGTMYTIYYHIELFAYYRMNHTTQSVGMGTLIKPDMNFNWCEDSQPYTDSWLWARAEHLDSKTKLDGQIFKPDKHICLGIKHGVGKTGGESHTTELHRYHGKQSGQDPNKEFLKNIVDTHSFNFYSNYFEHEKQTAKQV